MPSLPDPIVSLLSPFTSLFDARTWRKVQILLTGVILAPGRRTVTSALYALGLQEEGDWASPTACSRSGFRVQASGRYSSRSSNAWLRDPM